MSFKAKEPSTDTPQPTEARSRGWPHGAFSLRGRWIPGVPESPFTATLIRDLIAVRRREPLSPATYLERLRGYRYAARVVDLLGPEFVGALSKYSEPYEWVFMSAHAATDAAEWLVRCGRPYENHEWADSGHWVPK